MLPITGNTVAAIPRGQPLAQFPQRAQRDHHLPGSDQVAAIPARCAAIGQARYLTMWIMPSDNETLNAWDGVQEHSVKPDGVPHRQRNA